jgi:hypothetical protein
LVYDLCVMRNGVEGPAEMRKGIRRNRDSGLGTKD